jgi:hypothetical protein
VLMPPSKVAEVVVAVFVVAALMVVVFVVAVATTVVVDARSLTKFVARHVI